MCGGQFLRGSWCCVASAQLALLREVLWAVGAREPMSYSAHAADVVRSEEALAIIANHRQAQAAVKFGLSANVLIRSALPELKPRVSRGQNRSSTKTGGVAKCLIL